MHSDHIPRGPRNPPKSTPPRSRLQTPAACRSEVRAREPIFFPFAPPVTMYVCALLHLHFSLNGRAFKHLIEARQFADSARTTALLAEFQCAAGRMDEASQLKEKSTPARQNTHSIIKIGGWGG